MCLENTGVVSVEWSLALPSERDVDDKEGEANSGDYTDEQIQQNFIVDNHLYSISPKRGSLAPKEKATIALSYRHGYVGSHRMPIILNVKNGPASTGKRGRHETQWISSTIYFHLTGKRMTLLFSGTTVPATNVYLHVPSNRFSFMPVPIGERDAPVQVMTLQNCGLRPVDYEIDTSVLTAVCCC